MDYGSKYTDEKIAKVQRKLEAEYRTAQKEIQAKMDKFMESRKFKNDIMLKKKSRGEITEEEYMNWTNGQLFQWQQLQSQLDSVTDILANSNQVALDIINKECFSTFAENANWQSYLFESGEGINFGFGLYDSHAVSNLIKNNPRVLPAKKLDPVKDKAWNMKKIRSELSQSIIQGESLDKLAKRLAKATKSQNMNAMMTHARTALTGAQNAGRYQSLMNAKEMDINVVKEWMATLDYRTRDSHRDLDGEKQKVGDKWHPFKFSNGCRYPGDPEGPPREVYNCRCTLVGDIEDYPSEYKRYDNIDGVPVKNMTYKEWYEAKKKESPTVMDLIAKDKSKYSAVTYDALKKYAEEGVFPKGTSAYQKAKVRKLMDEYERKVGKVAPNLTDKYNDVKSRLNAIEAELKAKGAGKTFKFRDIRPNKTVTYSDYGSITKEELLTQRKIYEKEMDHYIKYFLEDDIMIDADKYRFVFDELSKYEKVDDLLKNEDFLLKKFKNIKNFDDVTLIENTDDLLDLWYVFADDSHYARYAREFRERILDIERFEKYGAEYSKLLAERNALTKELRELSKYAPKQTQLPRTAHYLDDVTDIGIRNYGYRDKIDTFIEDFAESVGMSNAEALERVENGLKRIINESDIVMRIDDDNLIRVLKDGRFKNQFETGTSGGAFSPSMRKTLENKMFNVPIDGISDADRPVYGMFAPKWNMNGVNSSSVIKYYEYGPGDWYGNGVTVILKKDNIINNATMTLGDSLDYEWMLVGTEANNIKYAGSYNGGNTLDTIARIDESSTIDEVHEAMMQYADYGDHYFECQLHGKQTHLIENIDFVVLAKEGDYGDLINELNKRGIKWVWTQ